MQGTDNIYASIATSGFSDNSLQMIDTLTNDILYGRKDFNGFTLSEHAGLCKGGAPLIGASIVVSYARRSLTTGSNAESSEGSSPANWQIDEEQERLLEEWARVKGLWFENSESIIEKNFGPMIAQGAEAKVYYKEGDPSVAKERTSIYSTTNKALEAIALHNYLFPETAMRATSLLYASVGYLLPARQ